MKVVIAAAGTGGHINPGIAIANKIKKEEPQSQILFIGTNRGLENDLVPRSGYDLKTINAYGIQRKLTLENIKRLYHTIHSIKVAKQILQEFKPDVVIGTGGYICIPVMLAANSLRIPIVLHESNAFPGVATKLLCKKANVVLVGFEDAKTRLTKAKKVIVTGTPTKVKALHFSEEEKRKLKQEWGLEQEKPIVLVFGGSQGAQSINNSVMDMILNNQNINYELMWAVGPSQYDILQEELKGKGKDINQIKNVKIVPYIYNMEQVMNVVDLVVCRSGAMTITEIANVGKSAIFIPYPYAAENHQEYNAKVLEKQGAAKIILDKDLNTSNLQNAICDIINDKQKRNRMGENARKVSIQNVEDKIYEEIKKVIITK